MTLGPTFVLTDKAEPDGRVQFDLGRWNENGMMSGVDAAEAPQGKAESVVRVETESDIAGRVELTLQLH